MSLVTRTATVGENHEVVLTGLPFESGSEVRIEIRIQDEALEKRTEVEADLSKYAGTLELREDPVEFQKRIRAEWDR